jgi:hypothetical protein
MSRHDSFEQQNPDKKSQAAQLAVLEASLRQLNSICSEVGVQYRHLHGSQANAQSFALRLAKKQKHSWDSPILFTTNYAADTSPAKNHQKKARLHFSKSPKP